MSRPDFFHDGNPHAAEVLIGVVATAGGLAKHLYESFSSKEPFRPWLFLAKVFTSGFSGWTLAQTARLVMPDGDFIVVCAAVGGWLGADAMAFVVEIIKKRFGGPSPHA